jgi:hypothetical protein
MDDDEFRRGAIDIQWLERRLPQILARSPGENAFKVAAIAGALLAERDRSARSSAATSSARGGTIRPEAVDSWKQAARIEGLRS